MDRGEEAGPSLTVTWSCPVGEPAAPRYLCTAQLRERCQSQGETTTDPKQRCRLGRWRLRAKCPLAPLRGPCSLRMAAPGRGSAEGEHHSLLSSRTTSSRASWLLLVQTASVFTA